MRMVAALPVEAPRSKVTAPVLEYLAAAYANREDPEFLDLWCEVYVGASTSARNFGAKIIPQIAEMEGFGLDVELRKGNQGWGVYIKATEIPETSDLAPPKEEEEEAPAAKDDDQEEAEAKKAKAEKKAKKKKAKAEKAKKKAKAEKAEEDPPEESEDQDPEDPEEKEEEEAEEAEATDLDSFDPLGLDDED